MATLENRSPSETYKDLLQVSNSNSGIDATARVVSDGEGTDSKLFLDTNRVGVGIAPTDGTLHVHTATAGSVTAPSVSADLIVENNDNAGITILTPDDKLGTIGFGSPADSIAGMVRYDETNKTMIFGTVEDTSAGNIKLITANEVTAMTIDSSQHVGIGVIPDGISFRVEKEVNGNWAGLIGNTHATNGSGLKVQAGDDADVDSFRVSNVSNSTLFNINGAGNTGVLASNPGAVTPNGYAGANGMFEVRAGASGGDAGVLIRRFDNSGDGVYGLDLWTDTNQAYNYIDSRGNLDGANLYIRTKTAGTPVNAIAIKGTGDIDYVGDANYNGSYIVNEQGRQNLTANSISSPYYALNGVNGYITIADTDQLSFTDGSVDKPFSISSWIYPTDATNWVIFQKGVNFSSSEYGFYINANDQLTIHCVDAGGSGTGVIGRKQTATIAENKWHHVVATYNANGTAGGLKLYLNGIQVDDADVNGNSYTKMGNSSAVAQIGFRDSDYSNGQIACVQVHNHELDSTEVKELYSGASVPFKYKFGGEKILASSNRQPSGSVGDWVFNGTAGGSIAWDSGLSAIKVTSGGSGTARGHLNTTYMQPLKTGQIIEFTAEVYIPSTNGSWTKIAMQQADLGGGSSTTENTIANVSTTNAWQSIKSTITVGTDLTGKIEVDGDTGSAGQIFYFRNISATLRGCVAEYDGSGIASDKWFDKSGNDLHGTVSGATVENAPSGDDGLVYEEGTFTPTVSGGITSVGYSTQVGTYVRVGNLVTFQFHVVVNSGSTASANFELATLPYTSRNTTGLQGGAYVVFQDNFDEDSSEQAKFNIEPNTTKIEVFKENGARFLGSNMDSANITLRLVGQYFV